MLIEIKEELFFGGRHSVHKLFVLRCDDCGQIYTKSYKKQIHDRILSGDQKYTFCCRKCYSHAMSRGGIACETYVNTRDYDVIVKKARETCMERYGVPNATMNDDIKEKIKNTVKERYGVDYLMQSDEMRERSRRTCVNRYGVDHVFSSHVVREKSKDTLLKTYGVDHPMKSSVIREKIVKTWMKNYGVDNPTKDDKIRRKTITTMIERFGVSTPMESEDIRSRFDFIAAARKAHQTMKLRGSYGKSRPEDKFYIALCDKFGRGNVERQACVNDWSIDFYIKNIDVYVQFDGVYWHGLDRPIAIIEEYRSPRDVVIHSTFLRDRQQFEWFNEHNMRLVRVTDEEFKRDNVACLLKIEEYTSG